MGVYSCIFFSFLLNIIGFLHSGLGTADAVCEPGFYGDNCLEECSPGCLETCDPTDGTCSCQLWWIGDACSQEVVSLGIPTEGPTIHSMTSSSALIILEQITNVHSGLSVFYKYAIEYKEETTTTWVEWQTKLTHDSSEYSFQHDNVTGLVYNTAYDVRVKSYRVVGADREETGCTEITRFRTSCIAPSEPRNVRLTAEETFDRVTLTITWQHPDVVGCTMIKHYSIWYLASSAASQDWTVIDLPPGESTSHTLTDLDTGSYVVRVVATNDENLSNFAQLFYDQGNSFRSEEDNNKNTILIVGIVVSFAVMVLIGGVVFLLYRKRRLRQQVPKTTLPEQSPPDEAPQQDPTTSEEGGSVGHTWAVADEEPASVYSTLTPELDNQYEKPHSYESPIPQYEVMKTT